MNLLFWNLKGNNLKRYIVDILHDKNIDIALFAEQQSVDFSEVENELKDEYYFVGLYGGCKRISVMARCGISVDEKSGQSRYLLLTVLYNNQKYILAGVHLQDRWTSDASKRIVTIGRLVNDLTNLEKSEKCKNSIIIGDFNANPYDDELLQMNAFNAVLFKDVIKKSATRIVDGIKYRRFYNPVLDYISEKTKNYGSFYHTSDSSSPIWHCLDQVLVSADLVDCIKNYEYLKYAKEKSRTFGAIFYPMIPSC